MPEKVLPDTLSFSAFERSLLKRGFRKIGGGEFRRDQKRLGLTPPSPRAGRETGYVFSASGLTVNVWTTFLEAEGVARDQDSGWVLIKDGDKVRHFARPMMRTKNFFYRLLWAACIAKWRVEHRPLCSTCHAFMDITNGKALKQRYWCCSKDHKAVNLSWDHGLHPAALKYLKQIRKERARYRRKLAKEGKTSGAALLKRVGWKAKRPENKL